MKKPVTLADFFLPINEEEHEPQTSSCNRISRIRYPSNSKDSEDDDELLLGNHVPVPPPLDGEDREGDIEEEEDEYLSDEILDEKDFVTDPNFYQEVIPEIEVGIYNPREPNHITSSWILFHFHFPHRSIMICYL